MLFNNEVLRWNEKDFRVIYIDGDLVHLFPMTSKGVKLTQVPYQELYRAKESGQAKEQADPFIDLRTKSPTGKTEQKALENYALIKDIVSNPKILTNAHARRMGLMKIIDEGKTNLTTGLRLLSTWMRKGQTPNALIPEYGKNTCSRITKKKTGPAGQSTSDVLPTTEETRQEMDRAFKKHLLVPQHKSVKTAYRCFLNDYAQKHPELEQKQLPSIYQFIHFYNRNYPKAVRRRLQNDPIHFNKDVRPLTGTTYDIAEAPGSIYEIDSTVADITLVSTEDRTKIVGRPVLYSVVDVYTGMIVGIHIALESAQFKLAADALYNAMTDKVEYCKKYGIEITQDQWPAQGVPRCIVADNGELAGLQIEHFARAYGTVISTTASYRGDEKGTVEMSLGYLQSVVTNFVTGVPDKIKLKKAGAKERRLEATLNINEYTQLIINAVLLANKRLRDNTPKGLNPEVAPTPLKLWEMNIARGHCELSKEPDQEQLRIALLPHKQASVSRKGFNLDGIRFTCNEAVAQGYLDRQTDSDCATMIIAYDPSSVDRTWAIPDPQQPLKAWPCDLARSSQHLKGMSWETALEYQKAASVTRQKAQREADIYASEIFKKNQEIINKSKKACVKTDESASSRLGKIAENRTTERRQQQSLNPRVPQEKTENPQIQKEIEEKEPADGYSYPVNLTDIAD